MDILWVDEDTSLTDGIGTLLQLRGYTVHRSENATDALRLIRSRGIGTYSVLIIDVMLTPGGDRETFNKQNTRDFVTTGLVLAEKLVENYGAAAAQRILLYSRATLPWVIRDIEKTASEFKLRWRRRNARLGPDGLFEGVMEIISAGLSSPSRSHG